MRCIVNSNLKFKIPSNRSHAKGFTLIEMIVALLLIVLLMSWGIPNYQNLKARRMVTDYSNEMLYSFTQARAEAVRYGSTVIVRPNGGSWQNGWTTIALGVDGSSDSNIAIQPAPNTRLTLSGHGGEMRFNSIGGLENNSDITFQIAHDYDSNIKRAVVVSLSGSSRVNML